MEEEIVKSVFLSPYFMILISWPADFCLPFITVPVVNNNEISDSLISPDPYGRNKINMAPALPGVSPASNNWKCTHNN